MSPKKAFSSFFIVVSVLSLLVALGFFSYFSRQAPFKIASVDSEKQDKVNADIEEFFEEDKLVDPFITPGPAAKKIIFDPRIDGRDPVFGEGALTIVEFSDFSCKFCGEQEKVIKEVVGEYGGKVKLVWKDFPDKDSVAYQAALAGRCAGAQGKFWQFHDFLFNKKELASLKFSDAAKENGLDEGAFLSCLKSGEFKSIIDSNIKEAGALRLPGVPFFFVGKQEILGAINKEDLKKIIDQALYELED
jgi:protein-disulfide isomerase